MTQSPCINICRMDAASGLCIGCFRTLEEITIWSRADEGRRTQILASVEKRRNENDPFAGELPGDNNR